GSRPADLAGRRRSFVVVAHAVVRDQPSRRRRMFPLEYLLAVSLLTSPPESAEQLATRATFAAVRPTLLNLALQWEVLDPREARYVLTRPEEFQSDLRLLQRRYQDLAQAPSVNDGYRFPPRSVVSDMLAFNRAYRQHLEDRKCVDLPHWWELHEAIQETD